MSGRYGGPNTSRYQQQQQQQPQQHNQNTQQNYRQQPQQQQQYQSQRPQHNQQQQSQQVYQSHSYGGDFDGKRHRRAIQRKTVDYQSTVMRMLEHRTLSAVDCPAKQFTQPNENFVCELKPVYACKSPASALASKFVHMSMNKQRCPINVVKFTPEGRRLITGSSSGEFTLWNGLTFNFETILQAHDKAVRAMEWSHNDTWMITADDAGIIKYWMSNMNNLKQFEGHRDVVRDISFAPTDSKFASCSDDGTIKIWNFLDATEEHILTGHGWDVKCINWHPYKGLLASGSKDNLVKLWDPKNGNCLTTLHGHKHTITGVEWNRDGNYLLTSSRDQIVRLFDVRTMKEVSSFRGHKKEATAISWHPHHENLFASGGADGSIFFWDIVRGESVGGMETAHDNGAVWSLDWHPMGHMLASGSNDFSTRFWTRNRPGDTMKERFDMGRAEAESLGLLEGLGNQEDDTDQKPSVYENLALNMNVGTAPGLGTSAGANVIPGMGIAKKIEKDGPIIPGLGGGMNKGSLPGLGRPDSGGGQPARKYQRQDNNNQRRDTGHGRHNSGHSQRGGDGRRRDPRSR